MDVPVDIDLRGTYLTVDEVAAELGLAVDSVRRYCNQSPPKLTGRKWGRDWVVAQSEVDRYKKERKARGRPKSPA